MSRRWAWTHAPAGGPGNISARFKDQGKTVILTTHYIEEAQALSDRVGIIDYGELIALGTPEELMAEHEAKDLESVFLKDHRPPDRGGKLR